MNIENELKPTLFKKKNLLCTLVFSSFYAHTMKCIDFIAEQNVIYLFIL